MSGCAECWGTGYHKGFGAPCGKGCIPHIKVDKQTDAYIVHSEPPLEGQCNKVAPCAAPGSAKNYMDDLLWRDFIRDKVFPAFEPLDLSPTNQALREFVRKVHEGGELMSLTMEGKWVILEVLHRFRNSDLIEAYKWPIGELSRRVAQRARA